MRFTALGVSRALPRVLGALALAAVAGCATTGPTAGAAADHPAANPKDPYESFNRKVFAFNDNLDTYALKPIAQGYQKIIPSPLRTGVHNFFGNFADAWSAVNQFLQGKGEDGARMTVRVLANSTLGIGGLFDPATPMGLERKPEDLGQTLGRWGLEPGPYLVLPLFGPSDVRDGIALPADDYVTPALLVDTTWQKVGVDAVGVVDARAGLLGASQILDDIALDRYTFLRDAYISRRRSLVYDGNPPDDPRSDDDDDKTAPTPPSAAAPAGAASAPQGGVKPMAPASPASGGQSSRSSSFATPTAAADTADFSARRLAYAMPIPPTPSTPTPPPVPGGVTPAPLPASAPSLPVPLPGPAPVPPPPASAPRA